VISVAPYMSLLTSLIRGFSHSRSTPAPRPPPTESDVDYWAWEVVLPLFVAIEAAVSLLAGALRTAPAARSRLNPVAIAAELTWKAPA
jgi:hypothetical protein